MGEGVELYGEGRFGLDQKPTRNSKTRSAHSMDAGQILDPAPVLLERFEGGKLFNFKDVEELRLQKARHKSRGTQIKEEEERLQDQTLAVVDKLTELQQVIELRKSLVLTVRPCTPPAHACPWGHARPCHPCGLLQACDGQQQTVTVPHIPEQADTKRAIWALLNLPVTVSVAGRSRCSASTQHLLPWSFADTNCALCAGLGGQHHHRLGRRAQARLPVLQLLLPSGRLERRGQGQEAAQPAQLAPRQEESHPRSGRGRRQQRVHALGEE